MNIKISDKNQFVKNSKATIIEILEMLNDLKDVKIYSLNPRKTSLVMIDVVNGFAKEGTLSSYRIKKLIPEIVNLSKACDIVKINKIAFADFHTGNSPEFHVYPKHCLSGTDEVEIVDEIKEVGKYLLINKNSTNGFLEEEFQIWLKENKDINNFIITGDCTDICVQQFAITLKTWFNMKNIKSRVIVPMNLVETYDLDLHNGDLMNVMALYNMINNGIEVVKSIEFGGEKNG